MLHPQKIDYKLFLYCRGELRASRYGEIKPETYDVGKNMTSQLDRYAMDRWIKVDK